MSTSARVLARYKTATASALRDLLVRVRHENVSGVRSKWGDCELVSDEFLSEARRAGLAPVGRSFIVWGERSYDPAFAARRRIERKNGQHQWVVVEGVIYDGTSDQFGDDEVTITREDDARYHELRRFGHTFRTAGLEVYLNDPGKVPGIGPERGKKPSGNGIAKFTSPHGSYRYVAYVDGKAVAALQVVSRDKKTAVIANVFTDPSTRRQGWASALLAQARKDFKKVEHASEDDLSGDGRAWRDRVKAASMWLDMAVDKMYPPVMEWVHRPSAGKGRVFEAYLSLNPKEKAAYDADVRAAFTRSHGAKIIAYRYKERPRHMGGMSLTTEEPVYLSPDMYTPYEVDVDDVLVHWAQDKMPLSGRTFGHEKELILKPEANPRVIRASDFAEAKSRIIAWIDSQGNPMTLYRAVRIPSADAIDLGNLGVFWTPNRLKADSPHGKEVRGEDVVIEILARRSDVDEFGTVATMRRYPGEEEIRLQADSSVTVVSLHTLGSNVSVRRTGRT